MKSSLVIVIVGTLLLFYIFIPRAIAWENKETHPEITQKAVERSILNNYLQIQLGLPFGLNTSFQLLEQYKNNLIKRAIQQKVSWDTTNLIVLDWVKAGSEFEDIPNPRARHHFYNPIDNTGLNNMIVDPFADIHAMLYYGSMLSYPDYWGFNLLGGSAVKRSLGCADDWGTDWESEPEYLTNKYNWPIARSLFWDAVTLQQDDYRKKSMGTMFLVLGHICHLLEDMGVPAHTRQDFLYGHLVGDFYEDLSGRKNPWIQAGHPFEAWMEQQIISNGQIPVEYLSRLMETPPVFAKFRHYWDTDFCVESGIPQWQGNNPGWPTSGFGNPPPEKSWGLAECTNYQFLSYSTVFRNPWLATVQYFYHPAKANTRLDWYFINDKKQYYRIGYDVPHLARKTFSSYIANIKGITLSIAPETTEDRKVYEDYAKRTIPRTIDYTTGLINYFFRGRLSAVPNCTNPDCSQMELQIINNSINSDIPQILKGGLFELYWDDEEGTRTKITSFTIPGWTSSSILNYGQSVTSQFTKPVPSSGHQISKYIIVYKGQISQNPADPDNDDLNAIAAYVFNPPNPPPHISNITPDMGCPDSILRIEGSGFSPTPSENIVSFTDANGILPVVYASVLEAANDGTWLTVDLPYFDAEEIDYYWTNTKVTANGSISNNYSFKLTNYIWCTIFLWDSGESIDDEFDLYINEEYWLTSYLATQGNPTVAEVGFWYEDEYNFVDVYLYDSYEESGGTLGIIIIPYVSRVIANRWNSLDELEEFLFDENFSGTFGGNFGSNVLVNLDDGVELDVYTTLTYSGSKDLTSPDFIQISQETNIKVSGERQGQIGSVRIDEIKHKPNIPKKRIKKYQAERLKDR